MLLHDHAIKKVVVGKSSSIRDHREVVLTTIALRHRVSTFARPVRTLDPARCSSSACAPSLSLSSSGKPLRVNPTLIGNNPIIALKN